MSNLGEESQSAVQSFSCQLQFIADLFAFLVQDSANLIRSDVLDIVTLFCKRAIIKIKEFSSEKDLILLPKFQGTDEMRFSDDIKITLLLKLSIIQNCVTSLLTISACFFMENKMQFKECSIDHVNEHSHILMNILQLSETQDYIFSQQMISLEDLHELNDGMCTKPEQKGFKLYVLRSLLQDQESGNYYEVTSLKNLCLLIAMGILPSWFVWQKGNKSQKFQLTADQRADYNSILQKLMLYLSNTSHVQIAHYLRSEN